MSAGDRPPSQARAGFARTFAASLLLAILLATGECMAGAPQSVSRSPARNPARATAPREQDFGSGLRRAPVPWDDETYRPTVVVRRGTSQGSGTIIASVDGETLVLTASHVVKTDGPIFVELHRYNLRMEGRAATPGAWPRVIRGCPRGRRYRRRPGDRAYRENDRAALCCSIQPRQRRSPAQFLGYVDRDRPGAQADTLEFSVGRNGHVRTQRQRQRAVRS